MNRIAILRAALAAAVGMGVLMTAIGCHWGGDHHDDHGYVDDHHDDHGDGDQGDHHDDHPDDHH